MSDGIEYYEVRAYGYEEGVLEEYKTLMTETFRDYDPNKALVKAKEFARYIESPTYEQRMVVEYSWEKINVRE